MKPLRNYLLFAALFGCLWSCSSEIEERSDEELGFSFFPLEAGKFIEYAIDSTIYDNNGSLIIEKQAFLREEIGESFINAEGNEVNLIERQWRRSIDDPWESIDVWSAEIHDLRAIKTEENLRFVKLIFPPEPGVEWDGNAFINDRIIIDVAGESIEVYKNWAYKILELADVESIGGQDYEQVLTIQQADDENQIERRYSIEKYAKGIGLIYKEMLILDTQCIDACASLGWEEKAEQGFIYRQTVLNHN